MGKGAAGMIIIRDEAEAALDLPRTYGVDDIPLILQSKAFDESGQIDIRGEDSFMVVNGVIEPYLEVPAQMVRFRMLNGSIARTYNIGVSDDRTFYQIGSDGGLLNAPVSLNRIVISPGEIMEFVVDFSSDEDKTLYLKSYASCKLPRKCRRSNLSTCRRNYNIKQQEKSIKQNEFKVIHLLL